MAVYSTRGWRVENIPVEVWERIPRHRRPLPWGGKEPAKSTDRENAKAGTLRPRIVQEICDGELWCIGSCRQASYVANEISE